jgi:hypothetical protein
MSELSRVVLFGNTNILFKTGAFDIDIREITFNLLLSVACLIEINALCSLILCLIPFNFSFLLVSIASYT